MEEVSKQVLAELGVYSEVIRQVFDGRDLTTLRTRQLRFERCSFVGADLRHAMLDGCFFKMCDLREANLRGASLRGVRLAGCGLQGADLRDADLTDAQLGLVNTGVHPYGQSDVTGADLTGATITGLRADQVIGWPPHPAGPAGRKRR
ncbi:pentapeptide repeat-containing protein [Spirillospora sp. NPDC049652]